VWLYQIHMSHTPLEVPGAWSPIDLRHSTCYSLFSKANDDMNCFILEQQRRTGVALHPLNQRRPTTRRQTVAQETARDEMITQTK